MKRYYTVYEFEKNGFVGRGATTGVVFKEYPPSSDDIAFIADAIRDQFDYDSVIILIWQPVSDVVTEADLPRGDE